MSYDYYDSNEFNKMLENREKRLDECSTCSGEGTIRKYGSSRSVLDYKEVKCPICGGTGKKVKYKPDDSDLFSNWS